VSKAVKLSLLAVLFAAGLVLAASLAVGGRALDTTTADTGFLDTTRAVAVTEVTTDAGVVTAPPPVTVFQTETTTVEHTTTRRVPVPAPATTSESSGSSTPDWTWVLIGILAVALVAVIVLLARRGHRGGGVSADERRRRLDGAVGSWAAQGWAVESDTGEEAVLRRGGELLLVSVDAAGHVASRPLPSGGYPQQH
jgi:hypothetical protein